MRYGLRFTAPPGVTPGWAIYYTEPPNGAIGPFSSVKLFRDGQLVTGCNLYPEVCYECEINRMIPQPEKPQIIQAAVGEVSFKGCCGYCFPASRASQWQSY